MKYSYSVIGHNKTPVEILIFMNILSKSLSKSHLLRTTCGSTFEASAYHGATKKITFSPWAGYNTKISNNEILLEESLEKDLKGLDLKVEMKYDNLMAWEEKIFYCMVASLFGTSLDEDERSSFLIHYKGESEPYLSDIIKIAKAYDIEVFDLDNKKNMERMVKMLKKKKIDINKEVEEIVEIWKKEPPIGVISCLKENLTSTKQIIQKLQV